jgi:hypothetical protein
MLALPAPLQVEVEFYCSSNGAHPHPHSLDAAGLVLPAWPGFCKRIMDIQQRKTWCWHYRSSTGRIHLQSKQGERDLSVEQSIPFMLIAA